MKAFISLLLLCAVFLSIFTLEVAYSTSLNTSTTPSSIGQELHDDQSAACDHTRMICHDCHLGHCAFTVVKQDRRYAVAPLERDFTCVHFAQVKSSFGSNLFRPPIS